MSLAQNIGDINGTKAANEIVDIGTRLKKEAAGTPSAKYLMITEEQLSSVITVLAVHHYVAAAKELAVLPELEDFVLREPETEEEPTPE